MIIEETAALRITGTGYGLQIDRQQAVAELTVGGRPIALLHLGSGVDTLDGPDEATRLDPPVLHREMEGTVVTWEGGSARWSRKQVELRAWNDGFRYGYTLEGQGSIDRAHLWRTRARAALAAKPDALVMTHTANPYLADLVDMLRLNDVAGLPDPQASILPDMRHRVRSARAASPWWLLDADNWPCSTRVQWRDYIRTQATGDLGVPSLYHAERLGWGPSNDALDEADYATIRAAGASYRARLAAEEVAL